MVRNIIRLAEYKKYMAQSILAIVGGGRWGQVLLSVIAGMHTPFDRIVIISKANAAEVAEIA